MKLLITDPFPTMSVRTTAGDLTLPDRPNPMTEVAHV